MTRTKLHFKELDQYEREYCGFNAHDEETKEKNDNLLFIENVSLNKNRY